MFLRPALPRLALIAAMALSGASTALAQRSRAGLYRAQEGQDSVSAIELTTDGRFRYELSKGALDEQASGRWTATPDGFLLDTLPRPRPPEWQIGEIGTAQGAAMSVKVVLWGGGGGSLPGIDLFVGFTNGDREAGTTQSDGWSLPADDKRQPVWIEFDEPIHGVSSPRFPLPARKNMAITVTLVPHDIGVADFRHAPATFTDDGIVLHWHGRDIHYVRVGRRRPQPVQP